MLFFNNRSFFIFKCHTETIRHIPVRQKLGLRKEYFLEKLCKGRQCEVLLKGNFALLHGAKNVYEYDLMWKLLKLVNKM
jgi:hypothetical protein